MKSHLKFSGVKAEFPELSAAEMKEWSFDFRPGGWVVATRVVEGKTERRRFFYQRSKDRFFAKFLRSSTVSSTSGSAIDFYGQKAEATRAGAAGAGNNDYIAQFPGKVRKLLVKNGDAVASGAPLVMVEAMKMEFAIKAESAGIVKKLLVTEGQQLTPGQKLLDFEVTK